ARMERQTSIPDKRGSMRSSNTRSGSTEANSRRASLPSRATVTANPSRARPTIRASMKDSSSSASRTFVRASSAATGWTELTAGAPVTRRAAPCSCRVLRRAREDEGEGRSLPLAGVDLDPALVVARHVADDRETEARAAGVAAAPVVDPIETLEDALEVAGRDTDAAVGHHQLYLAVRPAPRQAHHRVLVGEGDGVL